MKIRHIFLVALVMTFFACQHAPKFSVSGTITHAEGEMLYLEHTTLSRTVILDSCVLDTDGAFLFDAPAPQYPDFYRLRIGRMSLPLAIDSTEDIVLTTTLDSLPYTLSIVGSETTLAIARLKTMARQATKEQIKEQTQSLIIANPRSLVAYFAVFFKHNGEYIWNIYDPLDRRLYQAVATSFHTWMPEYERSKALHAQVSSVLKAERELQHQTAIRQLIHDAENAFLDITLQDENGETRALSELIGKVIVLDFSAIEMEQSKGYIFELRELYNHYHARGMSIYSVSLDRNKLLWEDGVVNLPWTNVYAGEKATEVLMTYNVQSIPTLFLLDRKGNVQGRYTDFQQLEADIRKYL